MNIPFLKKKTIIEMPAEKPQTSEINNVLDAIAPQHIEKDFDYVKINDVYFRTIFVGGYPRFVAPGWLEPVINFDSSLDISFYIYPVDGKSVLDDLRRKIAEMEAELSTDIERGKIVDPATTAKLEDAKSLQEQLVKGIERFYEFSFYITIPASSVEELNHVTRQIESVLGSLLIVSKHAMLDMEEGFLSTAPFGVDKLSITRNMDTTSVATTFPLTSSELSSDRGVLYGINSQNESFIIFDRFSLPNANCVIFASSGAGKCIEGNTEVLIKNSLGEIYLKKIKNVAKEIFENHLIQKFDEESDGVLKPNIQVYSYDKNLKGEWSEVEAVSRKAAPTNLFKIQTKSGREIMVTNDHSIVVLENGKLVNKPTEDIRNGDFLPIPREINDTLKNIDSYQSVGINKDLLILLGLTTSEGHIENDFVTISNTDQDILKIIEDCTKLLNYKISPSYNYPLRTQINGFHIRSHKFADFVNNIGGGGVSGEKRVPSFIFSLSNQQISYYLKAYFEGDGGTESHAITATTKSRCLASDLAYLLIRFGIIARISEEKKAATNTIDKIKRKYYRVSVSGQENVRNFIDQIGFITEKKNARAKDLLKNSNTNVDVVPEIKNVFREIYSELYNSEIPAPKMFSAIKLGTFNPSRENLFNLIEEMGNR